jgi:hypothetical protein
LSHLWLRCRDVLRHLLVLCSMLCSIVVLIHGAAERGETPTICYQPRPAPHPGLPGTVVRSNMGAGCRASRAELASAVSWSQLESAHTWSVQGMGWGGT